MNGKRLYQEVWEHPFPPIEDKHGFEYFEAYYDTCGVPDRLLTGDDYEKYDLEFIYFLLMQKFADNTVLSYDEEKFKLNVMSRIMMYAPELQRKMKMQDDILALTEEELENGTTEIANEADHPDTAPSDQYLDELPYIKAQAVRKLKRDKLDSVTRALEWLDSRDVDKFLNKFADLFQIVVYDTNDFIYCTKEDDDYVYYS